MFLKNLIWLGGKKISDKKINLLRSEIGWVIGGVGRFVGVVGGIVELYIFILLLDSVFFLVLDIIVGMGFLIDKFFVVFLFILAIVVKEYNYINM